MAYQMGMVDRNQMEMLFLFDTKAVDTSQTPLLLLVLFLKEVCTSTSLTTERQT